MTSPYRDTMAGGVARIGRILDSKVGHGCKTNTDWNRDLEDVRRVHGRRTRNEADHDWQKTAFERSESVSGCASACV
jgi:hypothetical protein